jgi:hypothetical protein
MSDPRDRLPPSSPQVTPPTNGLPAPPPKKVRRPHDPDAFLRYLLEEDTQTGQREDSFRFTGQRPLRPGRRPKVIRAYNGG